MHKLNTKVSLLWLCSIFIINIVQSQTLDPVIENPGVVEINKLPARASFFPYNSKEIAIEDEVNKASNYMLLNGISKFNWVKH